MATPTATNTLLKVMPQVTAVASAFTTASGHGRKFIGGSGPGCGVTQVEAAGGVEGVFGAPTGVAGG